MFTSGGNSRGSFWIFSYSAITFLVFIPAAGGSKKESSFEFSLGRDQKATFNFRGLFSCAAFEPTRDPNPLRPHHRLPYSIEGPNCNSFDSRRQAKPNGKTSSEKTHKNETRMKSHHDRWQQT